MDDRTRKRIAELQGRIAANPDDVQARFMLGDILSSVGQHEEAMPHYHHVVDYHTRTGQWLKAVAVLKHVLRAVPSDVRSTTTLATVNAGLGLHKESAVAFRRLADLLEGAGNTTGAADARNKAREQDLWLRRRPAPDDDDSGVH